MAYKVFLDVNVLLDFTLKRDNYVDCKKLKKETSTTLPILTAREFVLEYL